MGETLIDQFVRKCKHLQVLNMTGDDALDNEDKPNVVDLTARIIEEQEEDEM